MHAHVRCAKKHHFILNTKFIPDINVPYNKKESMPTILTIRIWHCYILYIINSPPNTYIVRHSSPQTFYDANSTHLPTRIVLITS